MSSPAEPKGRDRPAAGAAAIRLHRLDPDAFRQALAPDKDANPEAGAPPRPTPGADLWYLETAALIEDAGLIDACRAILSPEERERGDRFHFPHDRALHALSHALVRISLSYCQPRRPEAWEFTLGPYGKPDIAGNEDGPPLSFSLTHTAGLAACLTGPAGALGVDAEERLRPTDVATLARRYFAPSEAQALLSLDPDARQYRFFEYWTLKEAYAKAKGLGLRLPLDSFAFEIAPSGAIAITFPARDAVADGVGERPEDWTFRLFHPTAEHVLAAALGPPAARRGGVAFG